MFIVKIYVRRLKNVRDVHAHTGQKGPLGDPGLIAKAFHTGVTDEYSVGEVRIVNRNGLFWYDGGVDRNGLCLRLCHGRRFCLHRGLRFFFLASAVCEQFINLRVYLGFQSVFLKNIDEQIPFKDNQYNED